eukprot:TRINITY_DN2948_c0_g1_i1.p1 TRINITY_DN2948_c0_g1~~TRINITY_DN2948_c0_g1_i1.p1  ORF type:complete len:1095 (-),score=144.55 TRINITY_DN2948_c0_g1_i1:115-3399(-)
METDSSIQRSRSKDRCQPPFILAYTHVGIWFWLLVDHLQYYALLSLFPVTFLPSVGNFVSVYLSPLLFIINLPEFNRLFTQPANPVEPFAGTIWYYCSYLQIRQNALQLTTLIFFGIFIVGVFILFGIYCLFMKLCFHFVEDTPKAYLRGQAVALLVRTLLLALVPCTVTCAFHLGRFLSDLTALYVIAVITATFVLAYPIVLAVTVYVRRDSVSVPHVQLRFGGLFLQFHPHNYLYLIITLAKRLIIAGVVGGFNLYPRTSLSVLLGVQGVYIIVHLIRRPIFVPQAMALDLLAEIAIMSSLSLALATVVTTGSSSFGGGGSTDTMLIEVLHACGWAVVALHAAVIAISATMALLCGVTQVIMLVRSQLNRNTHNDVLPLTSAPRRVDGQSQISASTVPLREFHRPRNIGPTTPSSIAVGHDKSVFEIEELVPVASPTEVTGVSFSPMTMPTLAFVDDSDMLGRALAAAGSNDEAAKTPNVSPQSSPRTRPQQSPRNTPALQTLKLNQPSAQASASSLFARRMSRPANVNVTSVVVAEPPTLDLPIEETDDSDMLGRALAAAGSNDEAAKTPNVSPQSSPRTRPQQSPRNTPALQTLKLNQPSAQASASSLFARRMSRPANVNVTSVVVAEPPTLDLPIEETIAIDTPAPPSPSSPGSLAGRRSGFRPPTITIQPGPTSLLNSSVNREWTEKRERESQLAYYDNVCSKIIDGLYISSSIVAANQQMLRDNGITHVINCVGQACPNAFSDSLHYLTLYLSDSHMENLTCVFYEAIEFIQRARAENGRVMVHCKRGISRSCAVAMCYLMFTQKTAFRETLVLVQKSRAVASPNGGFFFQLQEWFDRLCRLTRVQHIGSPGGSEDSRLYRIALQSPREPNSLLVPKACTHIDAAVLDARGVFVLQPSQKPVYMWIGQYAIPSHVNAGRLAVCRLQRFEAATRRCIIERQDRESEEFWSLLNSVRPAGGVMCLKENDREYPDDITPNSMSPWQPFPAMLFKYPQWTRVHPFTVLDFECHQVLAVLTAPSAVQVTGATELLVWVGWEVDLSGEPLAQFCARVGYQCKQANEIRSEVPVRAMRHSADHSRLWSFVPMPR